MSIVRCYNFTHKFYVIFSILLLKLTCVPQNRRNAACTEANSFRFKDFEPRVSHIHYYNTTFTPTISIFNGRNFDNLIYKNQTHNNHRNMKDSNLDRESRGFYFQSTDKDTTVEVEFIIPFVRVPITQGVKLTKSTLRNLLNLRTGSILWTGAFLTVGALIAGTFNSIGALTPAFFPHKKSERNVRRQNEFDTFNKYIRSSKLSDENPYDIGTLLDEKLLEHNIDLNACIKSLICEYVKKAADNVRSGKASASQKILDGFANTQPLLQYFSGTAVQKVIEAGRNSNCNKWKRRCKFLTIEKSDILYLIYKYFNGY